MKRLSIVVLLGVARVAQADDPPDVVTAEAAYDAAKQLVTAGKYIEACPLFETSYHADPQLGVLLNLADCHAHVGRIATAWAEFTEAHELASRRNDARAGYAKTSADELAPRLAHLRVDRPATAVPGLTVQRDGVDITQLLDRDLPLDAGEHVITATAPDREPWRHTVEVVDGKTASVRIDGLRAAAALPAQTLFGSELDTTDPAYLHRRKVGRIVAWSSFGVLVAGLAVGANAYSIASDAGDPKNCDGKVCNAHGTQLANDARTWARIADVGLAIGSIGLITGWTISASAIPGLRVVPVLGPGAAGASVSGSF